MLKSMTRIKKPARHSCNKPLKACLSYGTQQDIMSAQGMKVSARFWSKKTRKWSKIYEVSAVVAF